MAELKYYFQVPRRYVPMETCQSSASSSNVHTFKLDFGTNWTINNDIYGENGLLYEATYGAPKERVMPVCVRQEATDEHKIASLCSSSACISFADTEGSLLRFETVVFDTTNNRYQWWVEVGGSNFVNDGILLLRIEDTDNDTRAIWNADNYPDGVIPLHASASAPLGSGQYPEVTSLPSYSSGNSNAPYKPIHTMMFLLVPNTNVASWKDRFDTFDQNTAFPQKFHILDFGPVKVETSCYGYYSPTFTTYVTDIYDISSNEASTPLNGVEWPNPGFPEITATYGSSLLSLYTVSWWFEDWNQEWIRYPYMAVSGSHNSSNSNSPLVHIVSYMQSGWTSAHGFSHIVVPSILTEGQLENSPLTISTDAPWRVSEIRFPAEDYFYNPATTELDGYHFPIAESEYSSIECSRYVHKMQNLLMFLQNQFLPLYLGDGEHEGEDTPVIQGPAPMPYPNRIEMTYQGLSGEQEI